MYTNVPYPSLEIKTRAYWKVHFIRRVGGMGIFLSSFLDLNWDKFPDCYRFDFSRAKLGLSAALHICARNRGTDTIGHVVFNRIKRLASMVLISDVFHSNKTYSSILPNIQKNWKSCLIVRITVPVSIFARSALLHPPLLLLPPPPPVTATVAEPLPTVTAAANFTILLQCFHHHCCLCHPHTLVTAAVWVDPDPFPNQIKIRIRIKYALLSL